MIGGRDITIETKKHNAVDLALDVIYSIWDNAIVEWEINDNEIFIYKDKESFLTIENLGVVSEVDDKLLYLIISSDHIHFVISCKEASETADIVSKIQDVIQ